MVSQGNQQTSANQYNQTSTPVQSSAYSTGYGTGSRSGRRWYRGIIEIGYGLRLNDYGSNNFKFNFINGVRLGKFSSLGLGIGYRNLYWKDKSDRYMVSSKKQMPVFIDFRTNFTSKKLTPYLSVGLGGSQSLGTSEATMEGLFFNTSGGAWYNISDRLAVFAGVVYELQKLEFSDTSPFTNNYTKNAHSLGINVGISF